MPSQTPATHPRSWNSSRFSVSIKRCCLWIIILLLSAGLSSAQTYRNIHEFLGTGDGAIPNGNVTFDSSGNMYGTSSGVFTSYGTVWKINTSGKFFLLHVFDSDTDGYGPVGNVTLDAMGNLYGTDYGDGRNFSNGNVWKIDTSGNYTPIYTFSGGDDGAQPDGSVLFDSAGNMYGTTSTGGMYGFGTVWMISASGNFSPIHAFSGGADGGYPTGSLTFDASGDLVGTASAYGLLTDGSQGAGTIWKIDASGFHVLHTFTFGPDGAFPYGGVAFDAVGNMVGTASNGGLAGPSSFGTVWKINPAGVFSVVHTFTDGVDGGEPDGPVSFDASGNMYGTSSIVGPFGESGTIWKISPGGSFKTIYTGDYNSGFDPSGGVTFDSLGNLYGTFSAGGPADYGTIWQISPQAYSLQYVAVTPNAVVSGNSTVVTIHLNGTAPGLGLTVALTASDPNVILPSTVTIPAGANQVQFTVGTNPIFAVDHVVISAIYNTEVVSTTLGLAASDAVHDIVINPGTVTGGTSTNGTVYLNSTALTDAWVTLGSSDSNAQFPVNPVKIPAGSNSVNFAVTTSPVFSIDSINVTATLGPKTVNCGLLLGITDSVHNITAAPSSVTGGGTSTGTVYLTTPAPAGGAVVTLFTSTPNLQVPSSVLIAAGANSATFTITASGVFTSEIDSVSAQLGNKTVSCGFGIGASAVMHSVSINPSSVVGGTSATGTVYLNGAAPIGGATIALSSSDPSAQPDVTVTIPAGQSSANFNVTTSPTTTTKNPQITATLNGKSASCGMIVGAVQLSGIHVPQTTLVGGTSEPVTVTLTGPAPAGGFTVYLSSTTGFAKLPASVVIPAGSNSTTVTLTTTATLNSATFIITATAGSKTSSINMLLNP